MRMASCVLHLLSFVYVVFTTHAQSTRSEYPGCVCTVNVPPSDCGQRSCPSVDVQLLRSSVVALQEQVVTLASDNRKLADDVGHLRRELSSNTGTINLSHPLTHTCMHARTHARSQTHTHARSHARTHARTRTRTRARTHARSHTHTHTHTRAHTHTHTRTHTHTHTHTHTQQACCESRVAKVSSLINEQYYIENNLCHWHNFVY